MAEAPALRVHRGTRAVQRLLEHAPSAGGLALWVSHQDVDDPAAPLLSTDGRSAFYGPGFDALPLAEQTGRVVHTVLHIALRHAPRFRALQGLLGDVDRELFNLCADALINSAIAHHAWLALPAGALRLDRLLAVALLQPQAEESALLAWDVERLYRALDDRRPPQAPAPRQDGRKAAAARALGRAHAHDLQPAADSAPEDETEATRAWTERLQRAYAGDGEFSLLRTLMADLPRSRTPWEQVLRVQLARALSPQPGLSWSRPSRSWLANRGRAGAHGRLPWEPGRSATRAVPRLVVMVDVSGSVDETLLARFAREVDALSRRLECGVTVVLGDDRVREVVHHAPGRSRLRDLVFTGGGETDFTPLLEEADRHAPDIGLFFTDLEGGTRFQPRWPVVWAVPGLPGRPWPQPGFGRVLELR
ncbi:MAG: hypothetical protein JNM33_08590 [Rubrivivax sp.]|nr:hypothetical protein [Rubrivivax sp.]